MTKLRIALVLAVIGLSGCGQSATRAYGGTTEINLPAGTKLVNATWKEDSIWYLTRPMRPDEKPERLTFQESSLYGVLEGKVIFIEKGSAQ